MKTHQLPLAITKSPTGRLPSSSFELTSSNLDDMLELFEGAKAEIVEPDYSRIEARLLIQYAGMGHLLHGVLDGLTFVGNKKEVGAVATIRRDPDNGLMYLCYAPGQEMVI